MEERVGPNAADDPQSQSLRPEPTSPTNSDNNNNLSLQLALPPAHRPLETYVIQVPKDQIYRVPPPEHALIVENHRKAAAKPAAGGKKRKRPCLMILIWIVIVLVVIGAIIGISLAVVYHHFTPKAPIFSLSSLHVKQFRDRPARFDVTLEAKNPNEKMGITYGSVSDEDVRLIFWTKTIGTGQIARLHQNSGVSEVVHVTLNGPEDVPVPPNVQKSMNDKKPEHQMSLELKLNSPLKLNVWKLQMWKREMDVVCKFRVNTLGVGTKIMSQDCKTTLS
ncbi:hypothetical protein COLO4_09942 [Corchorus olitorius]|uniref:Late embryogenesis abundant protein, LEA-14 n=1 Tax=Corchorus olitorius TaxID=93759 RepID=A0A1R3KAK0_9ROSI|nr:hypothetical protein COLO4_09942 [Corchorus olitorius]